MASTRNKRVAIVTGASSGMGREFACQIDKRDDVDELWLIARRESALEEVSATLQKPSRAVALDLTEKSAIEDLHNLLETEKPWVTYLVNAAGFAKFGDWKTVSEENTAAMIDLNCRAVASMTRTVLEYMHRGSHVIQIASASAFLALPHLNVYAATKAFVLRYTRGLRWELHGTGIATTALCPTWVKTGFERVARRSEGGKDVHHLIGAQKPSTVVSRALMANRLHAAVVCASPQAFLLRIVGKIVPNCITILFWELLRRL